MVLTYDIFNDALKQDGLLCFVWIFHCFLMYSEKKWRLFCLLLLLGLVKVVRNESRSFFAESEDRTTLLFLLDFAAVVAWRGPTFFFFRPIHPDVLYKSPVCLLPLPLSPPPPPPHTPPTMAAAAAFDLLDKFIPGASDSLTIVNATTAQNTLYPGVDFAALNWLERLWASYYIWVGNPIIATGLMSFVLHEVC